MYKYKFALLAVLSFALSMTKSYALSIDTMLLVGDESGNGVFTLSNHESYTSFITTKITKYDVQGETINKTLYTKDNIDEWEITLTHPKLILESERIKQVGVRSLCGLTCNFERDHVYQINFVPEPYAEDGEEKPIVALNVGYAPLYIIPAKEPKISYKIENQGDTLYVENTGNTFFLLGIDQCTSTVTSGCRAAYRVLSGRKKHFKIPKGVQAELLNVVVVSHDNSFVRRIKVKKE
ncbi:hypothetical protein [Photobacterium sp. 1_MG-2023]|uniref:hypothetical protein n=1 Tax=Photobacterium sp. 1_MG-2023 TaxID=3062646 RepID=UPI0026E27B1C|nr:hypothetical protein [Photobacterium sp. 1_MG-2023]MDO6708806.1 hypothetical protein [Photobacterium sp. 1_MG-2023]